jgi:hypothetical protein
MANLKLVADAMFYKRGDWKNLPDYEKESSFFIFNRYFSKKFPDKAQLLNLKVIDKVTAMELWFQFMRDKPYPNWFWSKAEKIEKSDYPEKDFNLLLRSLRLKVDDLKYLLDKFPDVMSEELKYYKSLEKENK